MLVLNTTYFGPVSWYARLARAAEPVYIEAHESFQKQTNRSRCRIATANGVQTLSVPVSMPKEPMESGKFDNIRSVRATLVSDHANWRHQHWNALVSAYGESPFFEYYADDIQPFFEPRWRNLFDYNLAIIDKVCELIDIHPEIRLTSEYVGVTPCEPVKVCPYYQVFAKKHGFIEDLSILDLLFNEGPQAILKLIRP